MKFAALMAFPAFCMLCYFMASRLNRDKWALDYYTRWKRTKIIVFLLWFLGICASIAGGILADYPQSWVLFQKGQLPTATSNTVIFIAAGAVTSITLIWRLIVGIYRAKYIVDEEAGSVGGPSFTIFWGKSKQFLQRASLFFMTIAYMPVWLFL